MPKAKVRSRCVLIEPLELRQLLTAITITKGGTYSGTWESFDRTPAVVIATKEPVIIENSTIRSRGNLIASGASHLNLTIRKTSGYGLNPNVAGVTPGRFLDVEEFNNIVVEECYLEGTSGIHLLNYWGDRTAGNTIKIRRNTVRNIDGRKSNGAGGYMDFNTRFRISDNGREDGFTLVQFVQLNKVNGVGNIEIAWNDIVNEAGKSRVEDNISIYNSSGTKTSPIRVHDNYIQGAYTIKPWEANSSNATYRYDWGYSGGGILVDGKGVTASQDPAWVQIYGNQVVSTTNYGIAIAAGHDSIFYNNRAVSSGKLSDGRTIAAQNVGYYIWDSYKKGSTRFFNNRGQDNVSGWMFGAVRNDWWVPGALSFTNNTRLVGAITTATEAAERTSWSERYAIEFKLTGTIAGTVYNDLDLDGIKDSNELGVGGFTLYLDKNNNGVKDAAEPQVTTTSTGRYTFSNQPPGSYAVRLNKRDLWRNSTATTATLSFSVGQTASRYFGVTQRPIVSGTVFMDANKNGVMDGLEVGMGGWRIYVDADQDGVLDANEINVLTNSAGKYSINLPATGYYQVRVVGSTNYRLISPAGGHRAITATPAQTISGQNFAEKRLT
jgi:hypothetical protein